MRISDLFSLKCWLALLMVYIELQQDDKFTWHDGDIVWLDERPAEEEQWALPL